jgi:hypothetical protein
MTEHMCHTRQAIQLEVEAEGKEHAAQYDPALPSE